MNQWHNGQSDGAYAQQGLGHINPSMFSNFNNSGQLDLNAFQQQQPGLANGGQVHTPVFPGQTFQPGAIVPQKRQHDGTGMSGSPHPSNPPNQASRSQTPNFAGGYPTQQPGQQFPGTTPTPYAHLQQPGSNHATPSPTMQNQPFRQPSRMSNASPTQFSHPQANFNGQMQNMNGQNMGGQGQMAALNQNFGMNANMNMSSMPGQVTNNLTPAQQQQQQQQQQQRQYQMRLMQQQAALRAQQQRQQNGASTVNNQGAGQNTVGMSQAQSGAGMQNGQQANPAQAKRNQFFTQCAQFVAKQGRQINLNPQVQGRPIDLYVLFQIVVSAGGSSNVDRNQQWPAIANKLGFIPAQSPTAGEEIKNIFAANVAPYERMWITARASQKQEMARQHAQQMAGFSGSNQGSPSKMQPPSQQFQQPQHTPQPQTTPVQAHAQIPQNGMSTPQQMMAGPGSLQHRRNSSMLKTMASQSTPHGANVQSPATKVQQSPTPKEEVVKEMSMAPYEPLSTDYMPNKMVLRGDGGILLDTLDQPCETILKNIPRMPDVREMGVIDIRAITLSLASGISSEVRYALDAFAKLSNELGLELDKCNDLIEVLIDCGEEQLEILVNATEEVSDSIDLASFEDVVRGARLEATTLQKIPDMGTTAYKMDRAADKVIAITTILRNLSFVPPNWRFLITPSVIQWLSNTLRHLGTRNTFLRSMRNVQDFYKDVVVFLSNVTQELELPSREDALHILHFLLVFSPQPTPRYTSSKGRLTFVPLEPSTHKCLPEAVDCLAKLLARQDPNRLFYRSIFSASPAGNNAGGKTPGEDPVDLLTRTFALALSVIPTPKIDIYLKALMRGVHTPRPYLMQGMLAADILTTLLPANDSSLACAWIESDDGWAAALLKLATMLAVPVTQGPQTPETESRRIIAHRGLSLLKRLVEKAGRTSAKRLLFQKDGTAESTTDKDDEPYAVKKFEACPDVMGAMLMVPSLDHVSLGLICGLYDLALQT